MFKDEPEALKRGKEFHREVQREWRAEAEGEVQPEKHVTKPTGRAGRIDIHVDADDQVVAVVEVKASDWDAMTPAALRRNVRRHARQIWDYVEAELLSEDRAVSPGIVFPARPTTRGRREEIEALFDEEGIPVVWQDETIQERRTRADKASNDG